MIDKYLVQVRRLVGDFSASQQNQFDLINYINQARRQLALEGKCLRQALSVNTSPGQETYPFSSVDISSLPGVDSIFRVAGITVLWGALQYTLGQVGFNKYQAWAKPWTTTLQSTPVVWAQVGDGDQAIVYQYPIPDQVYVETWDCYFIPKDILAESDLEALPAMFHQAVQYFAAYLCLQGMAADPEQARERTDVRLAMSDRYLKLYQKFMLSSRAASQSMMISNWYGRAW